MAAAKPFDVVLFGATGFTGRFIARTLSRLAGRQRLRIAVAGRDAARLGRIADELVASGDAASRPGVIIADVARPESLEAMATQARAVISAVGPFRHYGAAVVRACVKGGAHLVDISGEPEYMEGTERDAHDDAVKAGVCIVSGCGFDSVPADLGAQFAVETMAAAGASCTAVESYLSLHSGPKGFAGHYATWESAVYGFGSAKWLRSLRRDYVAKHPEAAAVPTYGPGLPRRGMWFWSRAMHAWAMTFMGSDAAVVRRSQRLLHQERAGTLAVGPLADGSRKPDARQVCIQYAAYFTIASTFYLAIFLLYGTVFGLLAGTKWGRSILLKHPKLFSNGKFSHEGPSAEQIAGTSFSMRFFAQGYRGDPPQKAASGGAGTTTTSSVTSPRLLPRPDTACTVEVRGAEPGYDATSAMVSACAIVLATESTVAPLGRVGVLTPAAAFRGTTLVKQLQELGITFQVVEAPHAVAAAKA